MLLRRDWILLLHCSSPLNKHRRFCLINLKEVKLLIFSGTLKWIKLERECVCIPLLSCGVCVCSLAFLWCVCVCVCSLAFLWGVCVFPCFPVVCECMCVLPCFPVGCVCVSDVHVFLRQVPAVIALTITAHLSLPPLTSSTSAFKSRLIQITVFLYATLDKHLENKCMCSHKHI